MVGKNQAYKTINSAIAQAQNGDTILVQKVITKKETSTSKNLLPWLESVDLFWTDKWSTKLFL